MTSEQHSATIIGLDLSIARTGICRLWPDGTSATSVVATKPGDGDLIDRLGTIVAAIDAELDAGCGLVVIEDLPPARANGMKVLGKLHGVVHWHLRRVRSSSHVLVPPSKLKKYATGRGNAPKLEMVVAARERLRLLILDDNEADAAWLAQIGAQLLPAGAEPIKVPKGHQVALEGLADQVSWAL